MPSKRVVIQLPEKKGSPFTLGDLRKFIAEMDDCGAAEISEISAKLGWLGTIVRLESTVVRFGDKAILPNTRKEPR